MGRRQMDMDDGMMQYKVDNIPFKNFNSPELKLVNGKGQSACWEFIRGEPGFYVISDNVPIEKYDPRQRRNDD